MKRLVFSSLLMGLAFAAAAQTSVPAPGETAAPKAAIAPASDAAHSASRDEVDKKEVNDRNCLRETGSRLIRSDSKGRKCSIAAGRSYDRRDIDRTGALGLQEALRRLDPAVR
jgi:ABC-type oligopeptide transport system substrate-binding subunit